MPDCHGPLIACVDGYDCDVSFPVCGILGYFFVVVRFLCEVHNISACGVIVSFGVPNSVLLRGYSFWMSSGVRFVGVSSWYTGFSVMCFCMNVFVSRVSSLLRLNMLGCMVRLLGIVGVVLSWCVLLVSSLWSLSS